MHNLLITILMCTVFSLMGFSQQSFATTKLSKVGESFSHPWGIAVLSPKRVLVTTRPGDLYLVQIDTGNQQKIASVPEVAEFRQGGLLDVEVRRYNNKVEVFLCYAKPTNSSKLVTAIHKANLVGLDLLEGQDIFISNKGSTSGVHFGCRLAISNKYIFASLGDHGDRSNAQNPQNHPGSIIRFPLIDDAERSSKSSNWLRETFSIGHRNPQGLTFHPITNELWSHEHGPRGGDEINIISKGNNYGWPTVSYGKEYIGGEIGLNYSPKGFTDPVWIWDPSIAPSGMAFYVGKMFKEFKNKLLLGSLKFMRLHILTLGENSKPVSETIILKHAIGRIRDVEVLPDGSILILNDEDDGGLYRLHRKN